MNGPYIYGRHQCQDPMVTDIHAGEEEEGGAGAQI
jgi:hypothetical protein